MVDGIVPFYPLYALLFAHTGLSDADISALFVIWTVTGLVAEVPMGVLADRFSRRYAVSAAGIGTAACFALWTVHPGFPAFACGFVLWGLGGSLSSGALEALVYDGLDGAGAAEGYPRVLGWIRAAELLAQVPTAAAAAGLFALGGYPPVGWTSVGMCLCAAALATLLPDTRGATDDGPGYWATLRAGVAEVTANRAVRRAVVAVALLGGVDAVEEYFALLAGRWGVPLTVIPFALLAIPVAGALGAAVGGRQRRLGAIMAAAAVVLAAAGVLHQLAGVAVFYFGYRLVWLAADARLQTDVGSTARATVTSVAELGTGMTCLLVYGAWALGQVTGVAVLCLAIAAALSIPQHIRGTRR